MLKTRDYAEVTLSYIAFMVIGMPGAILGVSWPSIQAYFGLSLDAVAVLLLASTAGYTFSSFFSGRVISGLGVRWAMALGAGVSAAGVFGYALAPSWVFMIGCGLITGLGGGIIDSGLNLHFARSYSPRLMNWLHAAFGLGAAIGPWLMTRILDAQLPWQTIYWVVAISQVVVSIGFAAIMRKTAASEINPEDNKPKKRVVVSIQDTLRQPLVWFSIAVFFFYAGIEITAGQWSYSLFTQARNIDIVTAGNWVSLYWASFTLGRIVFGFIASRVNITQSIRVCMVGIIAGAAMMWWNPTDAVSFAGLALIGFALAPIFPLLISTTPERLGDAHATNAIGFQVAAASLGIGVLPGLAGGLAAAIGLEIVSPYIALAAILMFAMFQLVSMRRFAFTLAQQV